MKLLNNHPNFSLMLFWAPKGDSEVTLVMHKYRCSATAIKKKKSGWIQLWIGALPALPQVGVGGSISVSHYIQKWLCDEQQGFWYLAPILPCVSPPSKHTTVSCFHFWEADHLISGTSWRSPSASFWLVGICGTAEEKAGKTRVEKCADPHCTRLIFSGYFAREKNRDEMSQVISSTLSRRWFRKSLWCQSSCFNPPALELEFYTKLLQRNYYSRCNNLLWIKSRW